MKYRTLSLLSLLAVAAVLLAACGSDAIRRTVYIAPTTVACEGVSTQECLLIKEDVNADWSRLYSPIEGFEYESGFRYQLRVEETALEDGSDVQLSLMEVMSREEATAEEIAIIEEAFAAGELIVEAQDETEGEDEHGEEAAAEGDDHADEAAEDEERAEEGAAADEERADEAGEPIEDDHGDEGDEHADAPTEETTAETAGETEEAATEGDSGGMDIADPTLTDIVWELSAIEMSNGNMLVPGNPDAYTLALLEGGVANVQADCNAGAGMYEATQDTLSLDVAYTRVLCAPGSFFDEYVQTLNTADSYSMGDGELQISSEENGMTLVFTP